MSRSLADVIESDVSTVFLNTDDFATSITYRRGGAEITGLAAVVDSSVFETTNTFGLTRVETRDFLISPSALVLFEEVILPQRGDTIVDGDYTYIVTNPASGAEYSYDDEDRNLLRIHTVLKKVA